MTTKFKKFSKTNKLTSELLKFDIKILSQVISAGFLNEIGQH